MALLEVMKVKEFIIDNPDQIPLLLHRAGFSDIDEYNNREYRCAWEDGYNPTAVRVKIDDLSASAFSMNVKGDLITLLREKLKLGHNKTLNWICDTCLIDKNTMKQDYEIELPFGGFYRKITRIKNYKYDDLITIPEKELCIYGCVPAMKFYKDNISVEVMEKFGVGYDSLTERITVPWKDWKSGECVGIMGRLNRELKEGEAKWFPISSFPKSQALFGLYENKDYIKEANTLFIFESEKGTLQLASYGMNLGISLGGNSLSQWQVNVIKSMFIDNIIVCLDEGLEESHSKQLAEQLKSTNFYRNRCGYVWDNDNTYLRKEMHESPTDRGKDIFKKIIKEKVKWI